jgi:3-hydroxybutyryl-CoA dehydrogenase
MDGCHSHICGVLLTFAIHDYVLKYLESSPKPFSLLAEKVSKGELGFKSGAWPKT